RQALRQLEGGLAGRYQGWAGRLARLLARQETFIEFEDEDLPEGLDAAVAEDAAALRDELAAEIAGAARGEALREGLRIAILGAPNAGKSSLLNALAGREAAIVSPQAGTTRDVVEARVVIAGVPVLLADTAGLRETADAIEAEGVRRARAQGQAAELVLAVFAADAAPDAETLALLEVGALAVVNKADLAAPALAGIAVSARTGAGLPALRAALEAAVRARAGLSDVASLTRPRHRAALADTIAALDALPQAALPELRAEALRAAMRALGRLTGAMGVEAILDLVFSEFCIGK
ncbi:MAG: GTP-binding protein, partial [Alphaproteobacteria bacterium]|nr:GTP-binding protein [Alphaproteobacteria bacterium]